MGLLTFSINVTLDGCVDHQEGIADDEEAPQAMRDWAIKLEAKPKYVVSSTRKDFPWTNSHLLSGDLRAGVQKLKDETAAGVLLGSGTRRLELVSAKPLQNGAVAMRYRRAR